MADKLTDEQKKQELEDDIIYVESETKEKEKGSALANNGCGVCERKGYPIFLVRKAPISKNYIFPGDSKNILSLKADNSEPEPDLLTHKYVYRTLRTGYVYVLVYNSSNVNGKEIGWEFLGYEVTPSGVFRHKSITDVKERNIKEIPLTCTNDNNHHIPGSFITIDTSVHTGDAYIAYSRRAWSQGENSTISKYLELINKKTIKIDLPSRSEATITDLKAFKRFTKINLTNEAFLAPEKLTNNGFRSFAFNDFKTNNLLLELTADPETIYWHDDKNGKNIKHTLITAHKFNSLKDMNHDKNTGQYTNTTSVIDTYVNALEKPKKYKVPVVLIDDPFGIAEELSLQRQLKIEPITQMIVRAETLYGEKIAEICEGNVSSTIPLDTKLQQVIDKYKNEHEQEAEIIYQGKQKIIGEEINEDWWSRTSEKKVVNDRFLSEEYYKSYNNIIDSGIATGYFNEKRLHLRKTLSLINEYRGQIDSTELQNAQDIICYDYQFTGYGGVNSNFVMSRYYEKQGYERQSLSDEQINDRLTEMNKGWLNSNYYYGVRAFKKNNTAAQQAKEKAEKEKEKYDHLLAKWREKDFIAEDAREYELLTSSIAEHSQDFFYYLTWLFGYKKCSEFAPINIKTYNDCHFWLIECDTNASNNQAGYLGDFVKLIDFTCLGNNKSQAQASIWDMLLNDTDSIFYHLINGRKDSLWELVLNLRLDNLTQDLSQYKDIAAEIAKNAAKSAQDRWDDDLKRQNEASKRLEKETEEILQKLETNEYKSKLDERFFWEKGRLILELSSMLVSRAASGIANKPYKEPSENKENEIRQQQIKFIFSQSAFVIRGDIVLYFKLENIRGDQLPYIIRYFAATENDGNNIPQIDYMPTTADAEATTDWDFVQVTADTLGLLIKLGEVAATGDAFKSGIDFAKKFGVFITLPRSTSGIESAIKFAIISSSFKSFGKEYLAQFKTDNGKSIPQTIKDAELVAARGDAKQISFASAKLFVAGLSAVATQMTYNDNLKKLASSAIGETLRLQIKRDVTFGFYKSIASYTNLVSEALNFANLTIPNALRASIQTSATVKLLTNGVLKATTAATAFVGVATSLITIAEGFFIIQNGMKKAGTLGTIHMIAGGLQMLAGVASLIQSVGLLFFAGPIGLGLFVVSLILGVVASILLYIYKDESDDWDKMQIWFNACLFGLWEHQDEDKQKPYPPTYEGMAFAINDYLTARMGLNAVIQLEKDPIYYATFMRSYIDDVQILPNYAEIVESTIKGRSRELYISITLPGYDPDFSLFTGSVRLFNGETNELVRVDVTAGDENPILKLNDKSPDDILIQRKGKLTPVTEKEDLVNRQVGKIEHYGDAIDEKGNSLGYFKVYYKVGEYCTNSQMRVYFQLQYWARGKQSQTKDNKMIDNKPLVLFYSYRHS